MEGRLWTDGWEGWGKQRKLEGSDHTDQWGWGNWVNAPSMRIFEQRLEECNFRDAEEKISKVCDLPSG